MLSREGNEGRDVIVACGYTYLAFSKVLQGGGTRSRADGGMCTTDSRRHRPLISYDLDFWH